MTVQSVLGVGPLIIPLLSSAACVSTASAQPESPPRALAPPGATSSACQFPSRSRASEGFVRLRVLVNRNGKALAVEVLEASDPIFADSARSCALTKTYQTARNAAGEEIVAYTPPFSITFIR